VGARQSTTFLAHSNSRGTGEAHRVNGVPTMTSLGEVQNSRGICRGYSRESIERCRFWLREAIKLLIKLLSESIIFGCCVRGFASMSGHSLPAAQTKQVNHHRP